MRRIASIVGLFLLLSAGPALAVGMLDATATSDSFLLMIKTSANSWSGVLRGYATDIFWTLAIIQFVWKFGMLVLKQTDFTEMAAEFVRFAVVIGVYATLLLYSVDWAQALIDSFRQAASSAAGLSTQLMPGDMFGLAIEFGKMVSKVKTLNPVTAFIVGWSVLFIVASFTFIAAFMMVTLIESYFIINAGVFFMAFGGSEWTREYAMAMVRYSFAIGAKLFVLHLLVGIIMTLGRQWQAAFTNDEVSTLVLFGVAFICAYGTKTLAETVQALITGVSPGGGNQLGAMIAAGIAGTAAGAAAMSTATSGGMMGGMGKSVTDFIKSSFSGNGGSSGGGSSTPGSFMNSGGGGYGSGSSGRSAGPSPRTGGGGYSQAPGTPPSSKPASQPTSGGQSSSSGSGSQSSAQPSSTASQTGVAGKLHAGLHMATEGAVRSASVVGSMTVPGMDSASASIGPPPTPPELSDIPQTTPENIIRPESASSVAGEEFGSQPEAPAKPAQPVDTLSSIQEALNKRGKPL